jgi:hypothetical protein
VSLGLFALAAWPLGLVDLPPLQDLPNHLASQHIADHRRLYPEFVFNGLFKSNALLSSWLWVTHGLLGFGLLHAGRAFAALVLGANALGLPYFVLWFAGRRPMLVASLFVWPLVHGFFVSMGMLNFSCAFPLSLCLLTVIDAQRRQPSWQRAVAITALSALVWYAHPFPLGVVVGLVSMDVARVLGWRRRLVAAGARLGPLAPVGILVGVTALRHLVKVDGAPAAAASEYIFQPAWALALHFWLDASGALTRWGSMTIVPALLLPWVASGTRRKSRTRNPGGSWVSGPAALVALAATYVALPFMLSNWAYLNCRLVPFLWAMLALGVPTTVPRWMPPVLLASAVTFSVVLGLDYLRLDRDRATFTAGISAVPEGAALLPLVFDRHGSADFTAPLTHAWAYYVLARDTSAPLVFAVERSYAITYRAFPPAALIPPALDRFAESHAGPPSEKCVAEGTGDLECQQEWRTRWMVFWRQAEPRFTHVLTWAMPAAARQAIVPRSFRRTFAVQGLEIYERDPPSDTSASLEAPGPKGPGGN